MVYQAKPDPFEAELFLRERASQTEYKHNRPRINHADKLALEILGQGSPFLEHDKEDHKTK